MNLSSENIRIASVKLEQTDLLADTVTNAKPKSNSEILLAPTLAHEMEVQLDPKPLNLFIHTLKIEYVRTQHDLQLHSKAVMILPLLPVLHLNRGLSLTPDRLEILWTKVAELWDTQVSHPIRVDQELFPDLSAVVDLFPNLKLISSGSASESRVSSLNKAVGLFQVSSDLAFLIKVVFMSKNTLYVQFKCPPGLSPETTGELIVIYNHILFLLSESPNPS